MLRERGGARSAVWAPSVRYEEKQRLARTPSLRQRLLKPFSERRYLVIYLEGEKKKNQNHNRAWCSGELNAATQSSFLHNI